MVCPKFHVKRKNLLAIAGIVWIIAGFNVTRLGVIAYGQMGYISGIYYLISLGVFLAFGTMFYKMVGKHSKRITGFKEATRPIWHFFDIKSYIIMAVMMGGGIWFRNSGIAPISFIGFFYTGLGLALFMAGMLFIYTYITYVENTTMDANMK